MLARMTDKNQLTIIDPLTCDFPADLPKSELYDVACEDGRIVLTPVTEAMIIKRADEAIEMIRAKGITEQDIADAIAWARGQTECRQRHAIYRFSREPSTCTVMTSMLWNF